MSTGVRTGSISTAAAETLLCPRINRVQDPVLILAQDLAQDPVLRAQDLAQDLAQDPVLNLAQDLAQDPVLRVQDPSAIS